MAYWLLKTEPEEWSWDDQQRVGTGPWDGVRNYQAAKHMKAMQLGDLAFFYHSGKRREIVGIVEIVGAFRADPASPGTAFGIVDVQARDALPRPVSLEQIKQDAELQDMQLLRQPRLSVSEVNEAQWGRLCRMGGLPQT